MDSMCNEMRERERDVSSIMLKFDTRIAGWIVVSFPMGKSIERGTNCEWVPGERY